MEPYSVEWQEARRNHIGSSDAPILMNVGRKTRYRLWMEKQGYIKNKVNEAMKRGTEMEATALAAYCQKAGVELAPRVIFADDFWYMSTLDGLSDDRKHCVELKMAGKEDQAAAEAGQVPEKYFPQLQHQLIGLEQYGIDCVHYHSVPHFSKDCTDGVTLKVYRDDKYISRLKPECHEFWERNLLGGEMPALSHQDVIARIDEPFVEKATKVTELMRQLKAIEKAQIEPIKGQIDELRRELEEMADGESCAGGGIQLMLKPRKGTLDADRLAAQIADLDKYRKPTTWYWEMRLDKK
jgi:putative phage-type endonuclease